jgi:mevalonate kinase
MNETPAAFNGKIILFGEYTIICGSQLLSVPYPRYQGKLMFPGHSVSQTSLKAMHRSQHELRRYCGWIRQLQTESVLLNDFDTRSFESDLQNGLFFDSAIPERYGLGSSGALCAALYHRYMACDTTNRKLGENSNADLVSLKKTFSRLEGYFHSTSSGVDPLTCYLSRPVLIYDADRIVTVRLPGESDQFNNRFFLVDTGKKGDTAHLVRHFLDAYKEDGFKKTVDSLIRPLIGECIDSLLTADEHRFLSCFKRLSGYQLEHFSTMIPENFRSIWERGLTTGDYYLKLCGSGGGGFILGISGEKVPGTSQVLVNEEIISRLTMTREGFI